MNPATESSRFRLALALHHALQQDCGLPSLAVLASLPIAYRDDNRFLWVEAECAWAADPAGAPAARRQQRRSIGLMEFVNEVDTETAGDDADEVWVLDGVLYDDDGSTWNAREGNAPVSDPYPYPEWDHRAQLYRPDWATVYEHRPRRGDPARVDGVLEAHKPVVARVRQIIDRLRPQGVTRMRGLEDGDELDLNAAVDAVVALRSGRVPDMRITMRNVVHDVVGDREKAEGMVAVRTRGGQDLGQMSVDDLIGRLRNEVAASSGTA